MFKGFKEFILRGNVLDLAVGVVIGAAFGAVVTSLVSDVINPLLGVIIRAPDLSGWTVTVGTNVFGWGKFLNTVIGFVLVALAIYLFVVVPTNRLKHKFTKHVGPTHKACAECLSEIPNAATRCAFCGQVQPGDV